MRQDYQTEYPPTFVGVILESGTDDIEYESLSHVDLGLLLALIDGEPITEGYWYESWLLIFLALPNRLWVGVELLMGGEWIGLLV